MAVWSYLKAQKRSKAVYDIVMHQAESTFQTKSETSVDLNSEPEEKIASEVPPSIGPQIELQDITKAEIRLSVNSLALQKSPRDFS
jgi:hypothetical protein